MLSTFSYIDSAILENEDNHQDFLNPCFSVLRKVQPITFMQACKNRCFVVSESNKSLARNDSLVCDIHQTVKNPPVCPCITTLQQSQSIESFSFYLL